MTSLAHSPADDPQYNLDGQKALVDGILARPGWTIARVARCLDVRPDSVSDWADARPEKRRLARYRTFCALRELAEGFASGTLAEEGRLAPRPHVKTHHGSVTFAVRPKDEAERLVDVKSRTRLFDEAARTIFGRHYETGFEARSPELAGVLKRLSAMTGYSERVLRRWLPPYGEKQVPSRALARAFQEAARQWSAPEAA